jgi:hypothetical protein
MGYFVGGPKNQPINGKTIVCTHVHVKIEEGQNTFALKLLNF